MKTSRHGWTLPATSGETALTSPAARLTPTYNKIGPVPRCEGDRAGKASRTMSNEHSTQPADSPLNRGDMSAHQRLIRDADLSSNARHVLHVLTGYADRDGGNCCPPVKRLIHDTGLSDRAVRRATKELRETGWLAVIARGGFRDGKNFASVYRLTVGRMTGGVLQEVQDRPGALLG